MSKPIIEVQNLSKYYRLGSIGATTLREDLGRLLKRNKTPTDNGSQRDFWALRDVSFSVQPGEVLGVIGRNGAGKSTLLKILSRITEPTSGRAILRGRVASLLEVGTGFHQDLSGRENVYLNGAILGMKKREIDARFDEIVTFSEVERFIDTPVKHYSSGMRVRLAFAVAAHLDSEILIVDEVLAVGDQSFQDKCIKTMGDVTRSGRTVLFVSHQLASVQALCTSCLHMHKGQLLQSGPTDEIVAAYLANHQASESWRRDIEPDTGQNVWFESIHLETGADNVACLRMDVHARKAQPASVELGLFDHLGIACGFGSCGYFGGHDVLTLPEGRSTWRLSLDLANLASGRYEIQLDLTVPQQAYLDRCPGRLMLSHHATPRAQEHRVLEASKGAGSWRLPVSFVQEKC